MVPTQYVKKKKKADEVLNPHTKITAHKKQMQNYTQRFNTWILA